MAHTHTVSGPQTPQGTYNGNTAINIDGFDGGAFYIGGTAWMTANNVTFTNNSGENGGAIYFFSSNASTIANSVFNGNTATTGDGGAIWNRGTLNISGSRFQNNQSAGLGGAIYNTGNLAVTDTVFGGNSAANGGSGIYNAISGNVTLDGITSNGDTFVNAGSTFNVYGGTFSGVLSGTTIENTGAGSMVIDGATLRNNSGASVVAQDSIGAMSIANAVFRNNSATGVDRSAAGSLNIYNVEFRENSGVGVSQKADGNINMDTVVFVDNTNAMVVRAGGSGTVRMTNITATGNNMAVTSGITNYGTTSSGAIGMSIENSMFSGNSGLSGVISNANGASMLIENSTFANNTGSLQGGAILHDSAGILTIRATGDGNWTRFEGNKDMAGANANDIYLGAGSDIRLEATDGGTMLFTGGIAGDGNNAVGIVGNANRAGFSLSRDAMNRPEILGGVKFYDYAQDLSGMDVNVENAILDFADGRLGTVSMNSLDMRGRDNYLVLDVDAANKRSTRLNFVNSAVGHGSLILNILTGGEVESDDGITFADLSNLSDPYSASFGISRVIGSPFEWNAGFRDPEHEWFLYTTGAVTAEVLGYMSLHMAAMSQTNTLLWNVKGRTVRDVPHDRYDYYREDAAGSVWVAPVAQMGSFSYPADADYTVLGAELGVDIFHNNNHTLGVFMSNRVGDYKLGGTGRIYNANYGSDISVGTRLYGLYYTGSVGGLYGFAAGYTGRHRMDITGDGMTADTRGSHMGGGVEAGYSWNITQNFAIVPNISYEYEKIGIDTIESLGLSAEYGDFIRTRIEPELRIVHSDRSEGGRVAKAYLAGGVSLENMGGNTVLISQIDPLASTEDDMKSVYFGAGWSTNLGPAWLVNIAANKHFGDRDDLVATLSARYMFGGTNRTNSDAWEQNNRVIEIDSEDYSTFSFPRYFEETITDFVRGDVRLEDPEQLDRIIERIKNSNMGDDYIVIVKGFLSQRDTNPRSLRAKQLILRRAQFIADQLALKGVPSGSIILDVKDGAEQVVTGDEQKDRRMNRRVVVTVVSRVRVKITEADEDKSLSQLTAETARMMEAVDRAQGVDPQAEADARAAQRQEKIKEAQQAISE